MCSFCDHEARAVRIDKMLTSGKFRWAYDVLDSLRRQIAEHRHLTVKQAALIMKIESKGRK